MSDDLAAPDDGPDPADVVPTDNSSAAPVDPDRVPPPSEAEGKATTATP